jgi:hypothetical protein
MWRIDRIHTEEAEESKAGLAALSAISGAFHQWRFTQVMKLLNRRRLTEKGKYSATDTAGAPRSMMQAIMTHSWMLQSDQI